LIDKITAKICAHIARVALLNWYDLLILLISVKYLAQEYKSRLIRELQGVLTKR